jgi:hypothetical protein
MTSLNYARKIPAAFIAFALSVMLFISPALADPAGSMEDKVKGWAMECRTEVSSTFEWLVTSNKLTMAQMFDTLYVPIPNTTPQKYHTQYDTLSDELIRPILDRYLGKDPKLIYVVAVDRNGYLPTHNSKYPERSKRIFDDRTGLTAARNTEPYLLQKYYRDTGETIYDLSVPLFVHGKHWGAIRIGYLP